MCFTEWVSRQKEIHIQNELYNEPLGFCPRERDQEEIHPHEDI